MALSRHFLNGTILFSSISPDYEKLLKDELYGCFKYIKIPFSELYNMPIRDRKYYIMRHNRTVEEENLEYERRMNQGTNKTEAIEKYTRREQENIKNANERNNGRQTYTKN